MPDQPPFRGLYTVPLGCDFSRTFLTGLTRRLARQPPEALARVEIFVNTRRTARRLQALLLQGEARLLPRIRLIADLAADPRAPVDLPPALPPLRHRLQLSQLVSALLTLEKDLAPRSAIFDLSDSLATLMEELHEEGINFSALEEVSVDDHSAHWDRSLKFLRILADGWREDSRPMSPSARQRRVIEAYASRWIKNPPDHPVIVAGSTGSRGATALFMRAVAGLPQGAVVLPGFDTDLPERVWQAMMDPRIRLDHPQSGFSRLCRSLEKNPAVLPLWLDQDLKDNPRNRLISLALRPAPITDQWLTEGPRLTPKIAVATKRMSLIEAQSPKEEASAIALCLRNAAEDGLKAALITPNRVLTRRVSAALKRWRIEPDDSAGQPLPLTPPGVLLRLVAESFGQRLTPQVLLAILKHPLTHSTKDTRGQHLIRSRDLELQVLRGGPPFVNFKALSEWADAQRNPVNSGVWAAWLCQALAPSEQQLEHRLSDWLALHRAAAETLAGGAGHTGTGELWRKEEGVEAARVFSELELHADAGGRMTAGEYKALFRAVLAKAEVRNTFTPHRNIAIWGTLEARVQGADLVVLGGLNDGVWPSTPKPDPWLNRAMRQRLGLPMPERRIGLSAHDFQQAVAAPEVVISRAIRDGEAPTVPSRWLTRFFNLLNGLGPEGKEALSAMKTRGSRWIDLAGLLDKPAKPDPAALRPSVQPPVSARPKKLSVTRIRTLVRDPYAIYAGNVLRLQPLKPLGMEPDALSRGIALHDVLEAFARQTADGVPTDARARFMRVSTEVLTKVAPWPAARRIWLARLERIADWFVAGETSRRTKAGLLAQERRGSTRIRDLNFTLTCKADRIDLAADGSLLIYDYKSGNPPTVGAIKQYDKQLQLEAAIAERGGFDDLAPAKVNHLEYIGLGKAGSVRCIPLEDGLVAGVWDELEQLIRAYQDQDQGYTARARIQTPSDASDYDHLSRRGEWEDSDDAVPVAVP
jgi:ATP-dependent helicase/nuclease subunit B